MKLFSAALIALVGLAASSPRQQCPLIMLRQDCPTDGKSTCWSPGENDIDCPNRGLCCFDGCYNTCDIPPALPIIPDEPELPCEPTYETHEEDVEEEVCNTIVGPEECVRITKEKCENVCETYEESVTVTENEHCCKTTHELECNQVPCDATRPVETPYKKEVCRKTEKQCYSVPEQICDGEEQVCKPYEEEVCKQVQGEPTKECFTKWEKECKMVPKYVCPQTAHKGFLKGHKFVKGCQHVTVEECHNVPWQMCNDVYPDPVTVCEKVVKEKCETKTVCRMADREVCNEATEEICEVVYETTEESVVNANCVNGEETYEVCNLVEKTDCEDVPTTVVKSIPKRSCDSACEPLTSVECTPGAPVEKCQTVVKRMFFDVPVQRC